VGLSYTHNTRVSDEHGPVVSVGLALSLNDGERFSVHREKKPNIEDRMMGCVWEVVVDEEEANPASNWCG
jgi:hypothetical protein